MNKLFITLLFTCISFASIAQSTTAKPYKVSIAFNSFASGVPSSEPLNAFIKKFKKDNKIEKNIAADHIGPLGREGEYKLGFTLKELTKKQQASFITKLKKVVDSMKDRGRAEMIENDTINMASISSRATVELQKF